jgi:predicted RNA methylase
MPKLLKKCLQSFLRASIRRLKSSKACQSLLMDNKNVEEFSNIFEHEKMLADEVRVTRYKRAIQRNIKQGEVVVDLGTGTGILSFFAARQRPRKIYAIDHSDFIEVARKIAEHNHIDNIDFVQTNSRDFMPEEKVDVILHEQIGDNLFDENMIENTLDLKRRMLKKTGRILPGKFELYLEPVSLENDYKVPFLWENEIEGIDFSFLRNLDEIESYKPADYTMDWLETSALKTFLCKPEAALAFDLNKLNSQDDLPQVIELSRTAVNPGALDGFCFYFRVIFDDEIQFDTSPVHTNTHWGNRLFRVESREVDRGDEISYRLTMNNILDIRTWSIEVTDEPVMEKIAQVG